MRPRVSVLLVSLALVAPFVIAASPPGFVPPAGTGSDAPDPPGSWQLPSEDGSIFPQRGLGLRSRVDRSTPHRADPHSDRAEVVCPVRPVEHDCPVWEGRTSSSGPTPIAGTPYANRNPVVSPDGATVFAAGFERNYFWLHPGGLVHGGSENIAIVAAYDAVSGEALWKARHESPTAIPHSDFRGIATSPDGSRVYAAGYMETDTADRQREILLVAFHAETGEVAWQARYAGAPYRDQWGWDVVPSPDGTSVYVTGNGLRTDNRRDTVTVAFDAETGQRRWASQHHAASEPGCSPANSGQSIDVSPDSARVFVGALAGRCGSAWDYGTLAYDAETGEELWAAYYGGDRSEVLEVLAVSPDGGTVAATGRTSSFGGSQIATVAYDAATGTEMWSARYASTDEESESTEAGRDVTFDTSGERLYVVGRQSTMAYDVVTGALEWKAPVQAGPAGSGVSLHRAALNFGGSQLLVAGWDAWTGTPGGSDVVVMAHEAATGELRWRGAYPAANGSGSGPVGLATDPDGSGVYIAAPSLARSDVGDPRAVQELLVAAFTATDEG